MANRKQNTNGERKLSLFFLLAKKKKPHHGVGNWQHKTKKWGIALLQCSTCCW